MKHEKLQDVSVVKVFVPGLDKTPGWQTLSREKQDRILLHTSNIQQFRQMQRLGEFGELLELTQVQQELEGEEMQMDNYLRQMYPLHHERTIARKQKAFAELAATIPNRILDKIASVGQDVMSKFDRIASAALGEIVNAVREMPLLPVSTEKDAEKYLEELNGRLIEERKNRRKTGLVEKITLPQTEKMAFNSVIHYMKYAKLKTSAQKRQWLTRVIGWVMQDQAIHGTLRAGRITIPDGTLVRRGRPPKAKKITAR